MSMSRTLLAAGLTLLACVPATAQAQGPTRPERPYRGIFASGVDYSGQSLTANGSLSGGYDDNVLAGATNQSSVRNQQGGTFGQASGCLNYTLNAERATVNAVAGTSQRYYPSLQNDYLRDLQRQHRRLAAGHGQAGHHAASGGVATSRIRSSRRFRGE